jgi:flagellar biosynthesis/type III secretory pathway chaperone
MERHEATSENRGSTPNREEGMLGNLLGLMENQIELYGNLKTTLSDEKSRIVSLDIKGLAETGRLKERLMTRIQNLESDRIIVMKSLSEMWDVAFQDLTLARLISRYRGRYKKRIIQSRITLLRLAEQIRHMNRQNKMLVRHTLELIAGSYAYLSQLAAPESIYQSSGGMRQRHQSGKFISNNI